MYHSLRYIHPHRGIQEGVDRGDKKTGRAADTPPHPHRDSPHHIRGTDRFHAFLVRKGANPADSSVHTHRGNRPGRSSSTSTRPACAKSYWPSPSTGYSGSTSWGGLRGLGPSSVAIFIIPYVGLGYAFVSLLPICLVLNDRSGNSTSQGQQASAAPPENLTSPERFSGTRPRRGSGTARRLKWRCTGTGARVWSRAAGS
jgi:hypothetical protein